MQNISITRESLEEYINVILFYLWDPIRLNQYCPRTKPGAVPVAPVDDEDDDIFVMKLDPNAPSRLQMGICDDEYKTYVPEFAAMLIAHASVREIYDNLRDIETNSMGGSGDKAVTRDVARRMYAIGQGITL
jgi:hypothetical protein